MMRIMTNRLEETNQVMCRGTVKGEEVLTIMEVIIIFISFFLQENNVEISRCIAPIVARFPLDHGCEAFLARPIPDTM